MHNEIQDELRVRLISEASAGLGLMGNVVLHPLMLPVQL